MVNLEIIDLDINEIIYTVKANETKEDIATKFNVPTKNIDDGGIKNLSIGDKVVVMFKYIKYHVVMPGQTLEDIANKYQVSVESIIQNNNISKLFVGQQLLISC